MFIAQSISEGITNNFGWIIGGVIVLIGLALGWQDLFRFNAKRIWAISSVCFRESMRRRVLLVTPLAILGIIAVSQLSHPNDEQDTIRQTTKYCLFASGIVVVIATLILGCTSLPKEIENRVIYTIVTKPTTRLEIVLGKTLGFARTSAAILLVMGIFSYIYLQINAAQLTSTIRAKLAVLPAADLSRDTLEHYVNEGLLQARTYSMPEGGGWGKTPGFQVYARVPAPGDKEKWIFGNGEHDVLFPFEVPDVVFSHPEAHLVFDLKVMVKQPRALNKREIESQGADPTATTRATTKPAEKLPPPAAINAAVLSENGIAIVPDKFLIDRIHTQDKQNREPDPFKNATVVNLEPQTRDGIARATLVVGAKSMQESVSRIPPTADGKRRIFLKLSGITPATQYGFAEDAVTLSAEMLDTDKKEVILAVAEKDSKAFPPIYRGAMSSNRYQQLRGDKNRDEAPVGVFQFRDEAFAPSGDAVPFEIRAKIDHTGVETAEAEDVTRMELVVVNRKTNQTSAPVEITIDSDRPTFFRVPRAAVEGGNFDLIARAKTDGHLVGLRPASVIGASSVRSFALNLFKSLVILWMLSVLVAIISVFCSTFVSWPIAVVLSLVLLLGRWCVVQLGDPSTPQEIVSGLFPTGTSPTATRFVSDTIDALNKLLGITGKVLPDIDQFRVTEDIERGINISLRTLYDPLTVIFTFGLPLLILAYIFLRQKEVAP